MMKTIVSSIKIRFVTIALLCFMLVFSGVFALVTITINISSHGTISYSGSQYRITGIDGVYTGTELVSPYRTTSNADAVTVTKTVFGWMSSGKSVELVGDFTWIGDIDLAKSITINCSQATITIAGPGSWQFTIRAQVTFLGGHTVDILAPATDYNPPNNGGHIIGGLNDARILLTNGASNSVFDGIDFQNYGVFFAYTTSFTGVTLQNCIFHDMPYTGSTLPVIGGSSGGYHTVQDCRFVHLRCQAIFLEGTNTNCVFLRNEFGDLAGVGGDSFHSFYLSGGDAAGGPGGYHTIANNIFHDMANYGGAIQIKSPHNKIYGNTFYNYENAVGLSIYSQWAGTIADDNEIYNNDFTDMVSALWIGKNDAVSPTQRTLVHDNTFTRVDFPVWLLLSGATSNADDTKVFYNSFRNCANPIYSQTPNRVHNTVVAYNFFDANVSALQLQSCINSMSYQNTYFPPNSTTLAISNFNFPLVTDPASYYYVAPRS